jgi:hypothetical protein
VAWIAIRKGTPDSAEAGRSALKQQLLSFLSSALAVFFRRKREPGVKAESEVGDRVRTRVGRTRRAIATPLHDGLQDRPPLLVHSPMAGPHQHRAGRRRAAWRVRLRTCLGYDVL